jgi:hypothetical protein
VILPGNAIDVLSQGAGDRDDVDRVVELAVAASGQPADLPPAGGHLDRGGGVAGSEMTSAGKAEHVPDIPDDRGGDQRVAGAAGCTEAVRASLAAT